VGAPVDDLRARAARLVAEAGPTARVGDLTATLGGGSLPGEGIPSAGVVLSGLSPDRLLAALREGDPAVVGRIAAGEVVLDLRTVDPSDDPALADALRDAIRANVP
jgi:L-seryl-tRNA(Ser) seleniumtransferase